MNDLRKLQLIQKETLEEVIRICKKNNIKYYMMYGTLLGAIRHQGFIPWDDDLDIAMERGEYNRFLECASRELNDRFFLHTYDSDPNYFVPFARVRRNNTTFIPAVYENTKFCNHGIWVDVFPLDFARSNKSIYEYIRYQSMRKILRPMASCNAVGAGANPRLRRRILAFVSRRFKIESILRMIERVSCAQNNRENKYYVCFGSPYRMEKSYFPVQDFGQGISAEFEHLACNVPENYDAVLKTIYGDYMKLPPKEQRVGHLPVKFDCSGVEVSEE